MRGITLAGLSLGIVGVLMSGTSASGIAPDGPGVAIKLGLAPPVLAAGGLTSTDASAVLGVIEEQESLVGQIAAYESAVDGHREDVVQLRAAVNNKPTDSNLRAAYNEARTQLANARSALQGSRNDLRAAALQVVQPATATRVVTCVGKTRHATPTKMHVLVLEKQEWTQLEADLISERRAARMGIQPPAEVQQRLLGIRSQPEVIQAEQDLVTNLASITQLFQN